MFSAVTISLVPEARGGPFVFWDNLAAGCEKAATLGFDAVEIFPRSAEEVDVPQLRTLLAQHRLKLAGMGTGAGWVVRKLRLTDSDPDIRRKAVGFAASIVDLAGELGAPAIVGSMQGRWDSAVSREQSQEWLAAGLTELAVRAGGHNVPLLFEPLNRYETNLFNRVADTLAFLKQLPSDNVKILCDLFHMNIEEVDIAEALLAAGLKLGHVHFVDSNRQAVGFGHMDMIPIAHALRDMDFTGGISAEAVPFPNSETAASQTLKAYRRFFQHS